ncbi:hypothetical protein ACFXAQ_13170, partial [Streptomyces olivaceus]|uniref:hypothetical protein n=1 Tax=Streptomyces olivaceus TaxID=47716 RepID=UPI003694CBBD
MGIRMLHHRTTTPARASTDRPARASHSPVPVCAPGASTGRIPTPLTTTLRRTATDLRRRLRHRPPALATPATAPAAPGGEPRRTPAWRLWADLARGYLALALTLLPRPHPRPGHTFTVFVAPTDTLTARPGGARAAPPPREAVLARGAVARGARPPKGGRPPADARPHDRRKCEACSRI